MNTKPQLRVVGYLDFDSCTIYPTKEAYIIGTANNYLKKNAEAGRKLLKQTLQAFTAERLKEKVKAARYTLKKAFSYINRSTLIACYNAIKAFNRSVESFLKINKF
jgi:hypothetical protein